MNVVFKGLKINRLWEDEALDLNRRKIKVQAEVSGLHKHTFPRWEIIHFDVPPRGDMPRVRINWYNGPGKAPAPRELIEEKMERKLDWGDAGEKRYQDHAGCLLVGTKGMLHSNGHNTIYSLHPKEKFEGFELSNPTLPRSRGHEREWVEAIKGNGTAMSNFDYSGPLTEFNMLGNVATQLEGAIEYDPVEMKIVNDEKADGLLYRQYRKGWAL